MNMNGTNNKSGMMPYHFPQQQQPQHQQSGIPPPHYGNQMAAHNAAHPGMYGHHMAGQHQQQQAYAYGQYGHMGAYQPYYAPMNYGANYHQYYQQYPQHPQTHPQPQPPLQHPQTHPQTQPPPQHPQSLPQPQPPPPQPPPATYSAAPTVQATSQYGAISAPPPHQPAAQVAPSYNTAKLPNAVPQNVPQTPVSISKPPPAPVTIPTEPIMPSSDPRSLADNTNTSTNLNDKNQSARSTEIVKKSLFNFDLQKHKIRLTSHNRKEGWQKYLNDEDRRSVENILNEAMEFDNQYANFEKEFTKMSCATSALGNTSLKMYNSMWSEWKGNLLARREQMTKLQESTLEKLYKKVCQNFPLFITKSELPSPAKPEPKPPLFPATSVNSTQGSVKPEISPQKPPGPEDRSYQPSPVPNQAATTLPTNSGQQQLSKSVAPPPQPQPRQNSFPSAPNARSQPQPGTTPTSTLHNIPGIPASEMGDVAVILQTNATIEATVADCLLDAEFQRAHNDFSFLRNQVKFVHDLLLQQKHRQKKNPFIYANPAQQQQQLMASAAANGNATRNSSRTAADGNATRNSTGTAANENATWNRTGTASAENSASQQQKKPLLATPYNYIEKEQSSFVKAEPRPVIDHLTSGLPLLPDPVSTSMSSAISTIGRPVTDHLTSGLSLLPDPVSTSMSSAIPTIGRPVSKPAPMLRPGSNIQTIGIAASSKSKYQTSSTFAPLSDDTETPTSMPVATLVPPIAASTVPARSVVSMKLQTSTPSNVTSKSADIFNEKEEKFSDKSKGEDVGLKPIPTLTRSRGKKNRDMPLPQSEVDADREVILNKEHSPTRHFIDIALSRFGSHSKSREREYSSKSHSESRYHSDLRDRDRDRDRDRERDRSHERDRDRGRDRDRERDRDRDRHSRRERDRDSPTLLSSSYGFKSTYYESPISLDIDSFLERERANLKNSDKPSFTEPQFFTVPRKYTEEPLYIKDLLDLPARPFRPPKICLILRGLPGSGKSFLARMIKDVEEQHDPLSKIRILSLDDYFVVEKPYGEELKLEYEYDPTKENDYKVDLFKAFRKTLLSGYADFVVVDAVNASITDVRQFYAFAVENNYIPYVVEMEAIVRRILDDCILGEEIVAYCYKHNRHGRSLTEIRVLYDSWELLPAEYLRVDAYMMVARSKAESASALELSNTPTVGDVPKFLSAILEDSKPQMKLTVHSDYDTEDVNTVQLPRIGQFEEQPRSEHLPPIYQQQPEPFRWATDRSDHIEDPHTDAYIRDRLPPVQPIVEEDYRYDEYKRPRYGDEVIPRIGMDCPPYEQRIYQYEQQRPPLSGQETQHTQEFASSTYYEQRPTSNYY